MYRYEFIDVQREQIAPFFPDRYHHDGAGRPWKDHRPLVNGILWHLHTGAPWPDTPECYGPWQTVSDRCNRGRKDGTWAKMLDALLLGLDKAGLIDRELWLVAASVIRASRAAAGAKTKLSPPPTLAGPEAVRLQEPPEHALGRSPGGGSTKVHLICEGHSTVLAVWVTPGQRQESQAFAAVMLRAPGHLVAPENRRRQAMSKREIHNSYGSPVGPTPCGLMPWAVPVPPRSVGGLLWRGQQLIQFSGSAPPPFVAPCPSHCEDQGKALFTSNGT